MLTIVPKVLGTAPDQVVRIYAGARVLSATLEHRESGSEIVINFWADIRRPEVERRFLLLKPGNPADSTRFEQYVGPVGIYHLFDMGEKR